MFRPSFRPVLQRDEIKALGNRMHISVGVAFVEGKSCRLVVSNNAHHVPDERQGGRFSGIVMHERASIEAP